MKSFNVYIHIFIPKRLRAREQRGRGSSSPYPPPRITNDTFQPKEEERQVQKILLTVISYSSLLVRGQLVECRSTSRELLLRFLHRRRPRFLACHYLVGHWGVPGGWTLDRGLALETVQPLFKALDGRCAVQFPSGRAVRTVPATARGATRP